MIKVIMDKQSNDHRLARLPLTIKKQACRCKYLFVWYLHNCLSNGSIAMCSITYIPCLKPYITSKP